MIPKTSRVRALAKPGNSVGATRATLLGEAYQRITEAMEAGFYLEAITLTESLLGDRLESRVSYLKQEDYGFKTLEKLIQQLRDNETDEELKSIVANQVTAWKNRRNSSLHEMAKLADGDTRTWADRLAELPSVAQEGLKVFRAVDRITKRLRRHGK